MQLRYNYRAYPDTTQRGALARVFGCARVVWNDCLRDRGHNAARNVLVEGRRVVAAGRAETRNASWSAGKTRTKVPAQRGEAGSHRKGQPTQTGIPGLQAREHVKASC